MQPTLNPSPPPSSMETRHRKTSDDTAAAAFSFPSTPVLSSSPSPSSSDDFEFGCLTPDSPSSDPNKNSPADHLFFNGRLLPHAFPFRSSTAAAANSAGPTRSASRGSSRTSSTSSKDYSLVSSRSNSTSSSCSSSARTSSSDSSERRQLYCRQGSKARSSGSGSGKAVSAHVYGSSQRWQFMAPVPALSREGSRRRRVVGERNEKEEKNAAAKKRRQRRRLGRRLFRWLVSACRKCHAIEPSRKVEVMRGKVNSR